jgi:hypothetical protein
VRQQFLCTATTNFPAVIEKEKFRMKENSGNLPKFEKSKEILQKDVDLYILISAKLLVRFHL